MALKQLIFIPILFCISCGTDICSNGFLTENGICVNTNGFPIKKEEIEKIISITESEVLKFDNHSLEEIREEYFDTKIKFYAPGEMKEYLAVTKYKTGPTVSSFRVDVPYQECLAFSALHHELLHVINLTLYKPLGDGSSSEAHPKGWFIHKTYTQKENKDSIENRIFKIIWYSLCAH